MELKSAHEYQRMTLSELKKLCKDHGMFRESLAKTKEGKKSELIARLSSLYSVEEGIINFDRVPRAQERDTDEKDLSKLTLGELKYLVAIRNQDRDKNNQIRLKSNVKKEDIIKLL